MFKKTKADQYGDYHSLQEYICNLCETKNIQIDLRFSCFGDTSVFYTKNKSFTVECVAYYCEDVDSIKQLLNYYLDTLWKESSLPNHRIALRIREIIEIDDGYYVFIGGCLFEDDALL